MMRKLVKRRATAMLLVISLIGYGCADLEVENLNARDRSIALSDPADLVSLSEGAMIDLMWTTMTFLVVNYDLQADIITSTNAANNYWGDADEPRRRIQNTTTFDDKGNIEFMWDGCYSAISSSNDLLGAIEGQGLVLEVDGEDFTTKTQAVAYMMRGIAYGYLSYIYDQGWIFSYDTELSELTEFVPHGDLLTESIASFEAAKAIYSANPDLVFDYVTTGDDLSAAETIQLANTYMARFMMGDARTEAESAAQSSAFYTQARDYAAAGLTEDWSPISDATIIYNGQHSWNTFQINPEGAAYLPVDLQVCYLFSTEGGGGTYNKVYPDAGILDPIVTDDARESSDFFYTTSIGWLREDRNRSIFSNYTFIRYIYNYQSTNTGNPMHIVTAYEADMLEAEAEYRLGNYAAAGAIIDAGDRTTRGGLPALPDYSAGTVADAIWYENIVGLHTNGAGIALAYMRRWDRMQPGSYLHLPVPAKELEIEGFDLYTFGGAGNEAEEGTSDGANDWKND